LRLGDDVTALDDWRDSPLLNGRGLLKAVLVDSAEQIVLYPHLLEARDRLHTLRGLEVHIIRRIHRPPPVPRHHRRRCHRRRRSTIWFWLERVKGGNEFGRLVQCASPRTG